MYLYYSGCYISSFRRTWFIHNWLIVMLNNASLKCILKLSLLLCLAGNPASSSFFNNNDGNSSQNHHIIKLSRLLKNDTSTNVPSYLMKAKNSSVSAPSYEGSHLPTSPSAVYLAQADASPSPIVSDASPSTIVSDDSPSPIISDASPSTIVIPIKSDSPSRSPSPIVTTSSDYPSKIPTTSKGPTTSYPPSDEPSDIPSSHPTIVPSIYPSGIPSTKPTPLITNTTEQSNIILILLGVDSNINVSSVDRRWATITSRHIQRYWNENLFQSPFFIGSVQTRLLSAERISLDETILVDYQVSATNLPLKLTYSQTINYALESDPGALYLDVNRQLFVLPFTQNSLPYTTDFVVVMQNGTGQVFFQSMLLNEVPTPAPTPELPVVERKRNIIISTVIAFVGTLLIFVGGQILYLIHFKDSEESVSEMQQNLPNDDVIHGRDDFYPERSNNYSDPKSGSDIVYGNVDNHNTVSRFEPEYSPQPELVSNHPQIKEKLFYNDKDYAFDTNGDDRLSLVDTEEVIVPETNRNNRFFDPLDSYVTPTHADGLTWGEIPDDKESPGNEQVEFDSQNSYRSSSIESDAGGSISSGQDSSNEESDQPHSPLGDESESTHLMLMNMGNFQMQIHDLE